MRAQLSQKCRQGWEEWYRRKY